MNQSFCIFDILLQSVAVALPFIVFVVSLGRGDRPSKALAAMFEFLLIFPVRPFTSCLVIKQRKIIGSRGKSHPMIARSIPSPTTNLFQKATNCRDSIFECSA